MTSVNDQSGHYAPGDYEMGLVFWRLEQFGADLGGLRFSRKGFKDAAAFFEAWKAQYMAPEEGEKDPSTEDL